MRRERDRYLTPDWATQALLLRFPQIRGTITDPCSGDRRMARALEAAGRVKGKGQVRTNDLDPAADADSHLDACDTAIWTPAPEWCVTNPPFNCAGEIAKAALEHCTVGVALLVRCTWLEQCGPSYLAPRGDRRWLPDNPPTAVISLPRISFTGDGKADSAPTWWVVWGPVQPGIFFAGPDVGQQTLALGAATCGAKHDDDDTGCTLPPGHPSGHRSAFGRRGELRWDEVINAPDA